MIEILRCSDYRGLVHVTRIPASVSDRTFPTMSTRRWRGESAMTVPGDRGPGPYQEGKGMGKGKGKGKGEGKRILTLTHRHGWAIGDYFTGFEFEVPDAPPGTEWVPGRVQGEYQLVSQDADDESDADAAFVKITAFNEWVLADESDEAVAGETCFGAARNVSPLPAP